MVNRLPQKRRFRSVSIFWLLPNMLTIGGFVSGLTALRFALDGRWAGVIVLITCAGGAFGHVLRQTGIAGTIENSLPATESGLMIVGFLVCVVVRTAQGSSTVAMITAVGVVAPIVAATTLSYHPVYIAIATGCGSKPISWMNDSGFWVISKMSGMTESEMLKTNTIMGIIMALTGLVVCLLGSRIFPMI